ncbi:hypothetical protein JOC75_003325 [Metabacillus crassostreae]|uniref:hypothetical protein n=1 Tax=Metabacillus crassostreae TaxID=929098 RepID=UPI00195B6277|nr:hypothetical protein [Metabacillus crassostreae]MBM7605302.1 hypothetical protein [Metabacillus crassostreae]
MKNLTNILYLNVALFMLVGCTGNKIEEATTNSSEKGSILESIEDDTTKKDESLSTSGSEEPDTVDANDASSEKTVNEVSDSTPSENSDSKVENKEEKETLSQYSSEQIEYARVWLQLGPNQEIDELNVRRIPAGEPVNIYDETSANYPSDVVTLEGSRSVDGSVTYSGNGDGTINVYNVPSHWASPAQVEENFMKDYTEDIINNTKLVYVDPGDNEKIIELIKMINIKY